MNAGPNTELPKKPPEDNTGSGDRIPVQSLDDFAPVDLYQKREKIFTRHITGYFQRLRLYTGWPLLLGYFLLPWFNWGERQAVLFDLPARQFYIFELTFWPQDFWLLAWLLIISAFALFTVTSLVGRLWCGYTCPQTVWTAIFMWIEQFSEGPRHQRIRLEQAPMSLEKARKRGLKYLMWFGVALATGVTFVGYFTPVRELVIDLPTLSLHPWALFWVAFFTAATYINAGWLREQVCIYMCPYARFQSAMFDQDTLIVSYDPNRGEPRGPRKRGADATELGLGDCIDCELCVQVCPTGIDIRDGLQIECIGCAHCIDACNEVMDKMDYPRGLIRYTTEHALTNQPSRILRPKVIGYGLAMAIMIGLFTYTLIHRELLSIDVIRERGDLYHITADNRIRNDYALQLINKTQQPTTVILNINVPDGTPLELSGQTELTIAGGEVLNVPVSLSIPADVLPGSLVDVTFEICDRDTPDLCAQQTNRFFGPSS